MTKRILTIIFTLVVAAIPALANVVTVNFGGILGPTDLTTTSVPVSGVTFFYDILGQDPPDVVTIDNSGIHGSNVGSLNGELDLLFAQPVVGLSFTYSVLDSAGGLADSVFGIIGSDVPSDSTGAFGYGSLALSPASVTPFSLAGLYLGDGSTSVSFAITSMEYDFTVPEPGTVALLACGLLGLCGRKLLRKRS